MKRVFISDDAHPSMLKMFEHAAVDVTVMADLNYDQLLAAVQGYDALIVRSKVVIDRAFLERCPSLRCIGRLGAGMETIDTAYAQQHGIVCLNSPEGNRDAVGEHAVGMLLALMDKMAVADSEVRHGLWRREANRGMEIKGRSVGIIGFGNMGRAFAQRLQGFECRLMAYDKYLPQGFAPSYVEEVDLDTLQMEADIVSVHMPLTEETRHMIDRRFIASMAKPFILINTSRGAVVDTEAVVEGLENGKIVGAALDVLEYENMSADGLGEIPEVMQRLLKANNTLFTPHVAGWTVESKEKLATVLAEKVIKVLQC